MENETRKKRKSKLQPLLQNSKSFFTNERSFSKLDMLLFINKRIKHNKKLAKKGVGMGYRDTGLKNK